MAARLTSFLENNNLISSKQFGFRKGHSTIHPMLLLDSFVAEALDKKHHAIAIFCDLRKAFDTVHHGRLLRKLKRMGVTGMALSWFKSYLTNRQQFTQIGEFSSNLLEILMGVPQGSILGPLLFLVYINDLPDATLLLALLFADDTTLLASHEDPEELFRIVNHEFKKVTDFFRKNLLAIHPAKTKYIFFSNSRNINVNSFHVNIDFNNDDYQFNPQLKSELARISGNEDDPCIRFLGLYLDPSLNYKSHIRHITKKISTALYFMRNAKNYLTPAALKLVYYSLVHSHIIYAIQVWSSSSLSNINQIHKLQKSAIRILCNSKYNAHTQPLFKQLGILPVPELVEYFKIQFMQKFSFGLLPAAFVNLWTTNAARNQANIHRYPLRNSDNLHIPLARLASNDNHPLYSFPRLWENFNDPQIKLIRNKLEFNSKLKKFFLNKLPDVPNCNRLFCPNCSLGT